MAQIIKKLYSDIDFTFTRTPGKNDIALSHDEMAVVRAVRYLLLTKNFERPFRSDIGTRIGQLLFEPMSYLTSESLKEEIETAIKNHEPRARVTQVTVREDPDNNSYGASIEFYIGNNVQPTAINLILKRTR